MTSRSDDLMFRGLSGRAGCPKCGGGDGSRRVRTEDWGFADERRLIASQLRIAERSAISTADRDADEVEGSAFLLAFEEVGGRPWHPGLRAADLEQLVASAITELPERFEDYTQRDLGVLGALRTTLLELHWRANADERRILDRLESRFEGDDQVLREVATAAELAELGAAGRVSLAVERAQAALNEYERRIGVPWPVPEVQMTMSEGPGGSLVDFLPGAAG